MPSMRDRTHFARLLRCPAADILLFDDVTVVYKAVGDLMFFVTGASDENEIILFTVLTTLAEALDNLLRYACSPSRYRTAGLHHHITSRSDHYLSCMALRLRGNYLVCL